MTFPGYGQGDCDRVQTLFLVAEFCEGSTAPPGVADRVDILTASNQGSCIHCDGPASSGSFMSFDQRTDRSMESLSNLFF